MGTSGFWSGNFTNDGAKDRHFLPVCLTEIHTEVLHTLETNEATNKSSVSMKSLVWTCVRCDRLHRRIILCGDLIRRRMVGMKCGQTRDHNSLRGLDFPGRSFDCIYCSVISFPFTTSICLL
jgi:hypothetical protein